MALRRLSAFLLVLVSNAPDAPAEEIPPVAIERSEATKQAIDYRFSPADQQLLDEIQRGCFLFMWREVGQPAQLVKDRRKVDVSSVAGVGFQLSALPIGIERGWISEAEGRTRAETILRSLMERSDNKKHGIYLHYVNQHTAGLKQGGNTEVQASPVDHAILTSGAIPAATYFGGRVAEYVDQLLGDANWKAYFNEQAGYIAFGWKPADRRNMDGPGEFNSLNWKWASAEEQLIYFMAIGCPTKDYRVEPAAYYRLQRRFMRHEGFPPFVVSWNSTLFTYFFSHCWIEYRRFGKDDPSAFGFDTPGVDWFENARRAVLVHRQRCIDASARFKTLGRNRWGLSPCMGFNDDGTDAYVVPELRPSVLDRDNWCGGTVAPHAAASSLVLAPTESMAALREMRHLKHDGKLIAWQPVSHDAASSGYGLVESFNLDQGRAQDDHVAIGVGPMLLAIENARTGLIWRLFHEHPAAQRAVQRLQWKEYE